jgi:hypothetical protein
MKSATEMRDEAKKLSDAARLLENLEFAVQELPINAFYNDDRDKLALLILGTENIRKNFDCTPTGLAKAMAFIDGFILGQSKTV